MRVETIAEQLLFVTVFVRATPEVGAPWSGTGFVYAIPTAKGSVHLLVTNKHVLQNAHTLELQFVRDANGTPELGKTVTATWTGFHPDLWYGHNDPAVDVAVIPLGPTLRRLTAEGQSPFFRSVAPDQLLSNKLSDSLDALERVIFVGYPAGLYDTANFTPIARQGLTATPIALNYQGKPAFLIDAAVFPGSSGSPVLLFDRGLYTSRGGGTVVGNRFALLGVLSAVHTDLLQGEVTEQPTALQAQVVTPIGLGIVFKAETVDACADRVLAVAQLERISQDATAEQGPSEADEQVAETQPEQ